MLVIFHPLEHMYSHSYVYSTDFSLYFRFTWTRNRVANEKGWLMPPFFVLGMFYNFNPVFQCPEHMDECTCVLLISFLILGLLGHQLSMPTPFMPLPPPHLALNEPPHTNQYRRTAPPHQHANQHWQTMSQQLRVAL
jgi:hypothetical protein